MSAQSSAVRVSVIVSAFNAAETLPRTLAALAAQELDGEYEVIVVDNGSSDETGRKAAEAGVTVLRNPNTLSVGASRNVGVKASRGEVIAFTDADCVPTRGWLAALLKAIEDAEIGQGRVEPVPGVPCGPFDRTVWVTGATGLFETANLYVRREIFEAVGGFGEGILDPVRERPFGEDAIFAWSAKRAGARSTFSHEALVHHEVFSRDARGWLQELRRVGFFPALIREVPELRHTFLYKRWFMSKRSGAFALAAASGLVAVAVRSPLPAAGTLPYLRFVYRDRTVYGVRAAVALAAGDAVRLLSLVRGSIRFRRPIL